MWTWSNWDISWDELSEFIIWDSDVFFDSTSLSVSGGLVPQTALRQDVSGEFGLSTILKKTSKGSTFYDGGLLRGRAVVAGVATSIIEVEGSLYSSVGVEGTGYTVIGFSGSLQFKADLLSSVSQSFSEKVVFSFNGNLFGALGSVYTDKVSFTTGTGVEAISNFYYDVWNDFAITSEVVPGVVQVFDEDHILTLGAGFDFYLLNWGRDIPAVKGEWSAEDSYADDGWGSEGSPAVNDWKREDGL